MVEEEEILPEISTNARGRTLSLDPDPFRQHLLDLGCGDGTYSIAAFQRGARVTGVDISGALLDSARRRAGACRASIEWCEASAESLPYASGIFDIALAVTILCLTRNPLQVLQEVARVLRPGGLLVIGELGRYSCWAVSRRIRGWLGSPRWTGVHFWTLAELKHLLRQTGFHVGRTRACIYYPPFGLAARSMGKYDDGFSFLGQIGAAFLAVSGNKL